MLTHGSRPHRAASLFAHLARINSALKICQLRASTQHRPAIHPALARTMGNRIHRHDFHSAFHIAKKSPSNSQSWSTLFPQCRSLRRRRLNVPNGSRIAPSFCFQRIFWIDGSAQALHFLAGVSPRECQDAPPFRGLTATPVGSSPRKRHCLIVALRRITAVSGLARSDPLRGTHCALLGRFSCLAFQTIQRPPSAETKTGD